MRYKEYKLGDVFSVESVNKLSIPGKITLWTEISSIKTEQYLILQLFQPITELQDIRVNMMPTTKEIVLHYQLQQIVPTQFFYQEGDFIGRQQIAGIRRKDGQYMGHYIGLYIASIIKKITSSFNYSNKLTKDFLRNCIISLPVKTAFVPDFESLEILAGGYRYE